MSSADREACDRTSMSADHQIGDRAGMSDNREVRKRRRMSADHEAGHGTGISPGHEVGKRTNMSADQEPGNIISTVSSQFGSHMTDTIMNGSQAISHINGLSPYTTRPSDGRGTSSDGDGILAKFLLGNVTDEWPDAAAQPSCHQRALSSTPPVGEPTAYDFDTDDIPLQFDEASLETIGCRSDLLKSLLDEISTPWSFRKLPSAAGDSAGRENSRAALECFRSPGFDSTRSDVLPFESMSPDYEHDIYIYSKEREWTFRWSDQVTPRSPVLTEQARAALVDRMAAVQHRNSFKAETLFIAVKLFDRYLAATPEQPQTERRLWLAGFVAFRIASKYEERWQPTTERLRAEFILDYVYESSEASVLEKEMLLALNYEIGIPTSQAFLQHYAKQRRLRRDVWLLAGYILEMSLLSYRPAEHPDHVLAAGALWLAHRMKHIPSADLAEAAEQELVHTLGAASHLNDLLHRASTLHAAVRLKYSTEVLCYSASVPLVEL